MAKYMVQKASSTGYIDVVEGIARKTLVYGDNTLMAEFTLAKGRTLPMHGHPQEQTGYLVSGHIILTIDRTPHNMRPGDSWCIPGNVQHGTEIMEDSLAIEVFSPVREDYKP